MRPISTLLFDLLVLFNSIDLINSMNPWGNNDFGAIIVNLRNMTATYAHNTALEEERTQQRNFQHHINQNQSSEAAETRTQKHENIRTKNQIDLKRPPENFSYHRIPIGNLVKPIIINNKARHLRLQPTQKRLGTRFF